MKNRCRNIAICAVVMLVSGQSISLAQSPSTIDGFTPDASAAERKIEDQFRAAPSAATAREELRRLTSEAHIAGSPEDYATAVYVRDQMRGFGFNSEIIPLPQAERSFRSTMATAPPAILLRLWFT